MSDGERTRLLDRLDETRNTIEKILPMIDKDGEIYPDWTIKQMLAHMTGWDDATIDSIKAHVIGRPPSVDAIRSLDEYNERTVTTREDLDYDHILNEWRLTRQVLRTLIEQMPAEKFSTPLVVPWGEKSSVADLVETFRGHEEEHIRDILEWMQEPSQPLQKAGN
jgi:hypothetical protein